MTTSARCRTVTVPRGFDYNVYYTPATTPGKPTLLFLHGFPSTIYDWRKQLPYFEERGFGVAAPDLLGAGQSSKPTDPKAIRMNAMAQDIIDILDALGLQQVVGVGHDWGSMLLSRLSMLHQDRFQGLVWLAVGFRPATLPPHLETGEIVPGYDPYAYWEFFTRADAADVIRDNVDSFLELVYPKDPACWLTWIAQRGKTAECIKNGILVGRAEWLSDEEYTRIREDLLKYGVASSLLWYVCEQAGENHDDNLKIPEEAFTIRVPVLYIGASKDYICLESTSLPLMQKYATTLQTASLPGGHWIQSECADELNTILHDWLAKIGR